MGDRKFKFTLIPLLLWCIISFSSPQTQAQGLCDINHLIKEDPLIYAKVLWFDALPREEFNTRVRETLIAAVERLKAADREQGERIFTNLFPENDDPFKDRKILISKTPNRHIIADGDTIQAIVLPFYLFLTDDPIEVVTLNIATLAGEHIGTNSSYTWARGYLNLPPMTGPTICGVPDYIGRLRGEPKISIDDFIDIDHLGNMTLRFRILTDHEGLMVPVHHETALIDVIEGAPREYPIEEIPLERLLHRVELQLVKKLISDIQHDELHNEDLIWVGEGITSMIIWILFDRKAKMIENAWIRRPTRLLLFIGSFIIFDQVLHAGVEKSGLKQWINESNIDQRGRYQETLSLLMGAYEKAKIGSFNVELFKREFCYSLGLHYEEARDIYLTEDEQTVLAMVEADFNRYLQKQEGTARQNLAKARLWLQRLREARSFINRENGLVYFTIPPRDISTLEQGAEYAVVGGMVAMAGEFIYNKFRQIKHILHTGRIFGGVALSALAIDYLLGVSAADPITLSQDQKESLEEELSKLESHLIQVINTYQLLLRGPVLKRD